MVTLSLSCFNTFQESPPLSAGQRVRQCAPCSIIFKMKLFIAVFRERSCLHCQGNTVLSMCYRGQHVFKIWGMIMVFMQFVFSISWRRIWRYSANGACFLYANIYLCISCVLQSQSIILATTNHGVVWTGGQDFTSNLPQTVSSSNSPFCRIKAAFQLSHHLPSRYLPHSNCDLSLCWTPASVLTPFKSMD